MTNNSKDLFWSDFLIESKSNYVGIAGSIRIKGDWSKSGMIWPNLETNHTKEEWDQIFKNFKDTCCFYNPNSFKGIHGAWTSTKTEARSRGRHKEKLKFLAKVGESDFNIETNSGHSKAHKRFLDISWNKQDQLHASSHP